MHLVYLHLVSEPCEEIMKRESLKGEPKMNEERIGEQRSTLGRQQQMFVWRNGPTFKTPSKQSLTVKRNMFKKYAKDLRLWLAVYLCFGGGECFRSEGSENPSDVPGFCQAHGGSDLGILIWSRLGRLDETFDIIWSFRDQEWAWDSVGGKKNLNSGGIMMFVVAMIGIIKEMRWFTTACPS